MKRLGIKIGWITALIFCLYSCTKFGKNVTIEGQVLNPVTNKPISGITVFLHINHNYKTIKKTVTGADGHFELSAGRIGPVWAGFNYDNYMKYYALGWDYNGPNGKYYKEIRLDKGHTMHVNCYLVPYGKYKSIVHNVNCQGVDDTAYFKWKYTLDPNMYGSWSPPRVGCYNYTNPNPVKMPCGKYISIGKIIRSGNISYVYDTVFIKKNQVTTLTINY